MTRPALPLRRAAAHGLAAATGLLYFLAFPGVSIWPLSFVAFVPLLVALEGQPWRRAATLGWTSGFVMTMTGFYWLLEMLRVFSGFPTPVCLLFMALLCGYQGGRIALFGGLYGAGRARGWPRLPVALAAFAASELVYPLLFPWFYGATTDPVPALMQTAELGGPILVGLVLLTTNVALAEGLLARAARRPICRTTAAVGLAAPIAAVVYGWLAIGRVERAMRAAPPVRVGIVQPNLPLFERQRARAAHVTATKKLAAEGAELVVWSEAVIPTPFPEATYQDDMRRLLTQGLGVPTIVGGVLYRGSDPRTARWFNTALAADATGTFTSRYDKQFLLAFGEYLPFGESFPELYRYSPNSGRFSSGESLAPLQLGEHRIAALICYEDILPSFVNGMVRQANPHLLVNLTNDAWFGDSTEPWIHLSLAKFRAVEHRRYLVRATNSGVSATIDPLGRLVGHGGTFREETLLHEARWMTASTLYEIVGDVPYWLATLLALGFAVRDRPGRRAALAEAPPSPRAPDDDAPTDEDDDEDASRPPRRRPT